VATINLKGGDREKSAERGVIVKSSPCGGKKKSSQDQGGVYATLSKEEKKISTM